MARRFEVYRCEICGNIVLVLHGGRGQLICCGQPMNLLEEQREEKGYEKHVPIIEEMEGGVRIKVGSIPHPMEQQHYIEWIEAQTERDLMIRFLEPGEEPETIFKTSGKVRKVREYCNIHGLWST